MSIAWANLLDWSCYAAAGATGSQTAAELITDKLWQEGTYEPDQEWFTRPVEDYCWGTGETFYLTSFLEANCVGQCNDFSSFLSVSLMSVGIAGSSVVRSYSRDITLGCPVPPSGWKFALQTEPLIRAGSTEAGVVAFRYHQFVSYGASYWDATVKYDCTGVWSPAKGLGLTQFKDCHVDIFLADTTNDGQLDTWFNVGDPNDPWAPTAISTVLSTQSPPA